MPKLIAFHLPQFHPIPENDEWWGKGFTEWTNVTKAKPLFKGHYQPHLPADLGFYDLRLPEARQAQADMAKAYGVYGFCYYHYWFNGRRLLERPVNDIVQTGQPDFPFMLCWANENWTRRWDGGDETVLMAQSYSREDAFNHIKALIPIFKDSRYIRSSGKPVFAIYRSTAIPNLAEILDVFREEAIKEGLELSIVRIESFGEGGLTHMAGFDAAIEFQPFSAFLNGYKQQVVTYEYKRNWKKRIQNKVLQLTGSKQKYLSNIWQHYNHLDYAKYVDYVLAHYQYPSDYQRYPCICPAWDNTARKGKDAFLFKNSTPSKFMEWYTFHKTHLVQSNAEDNFIFINAWNEWAEGNHLEPCQKWGHAYLKALCT